MAVLKLDSKLCFNKKVWIVAFFIALITLFVYLPALQNGFVNWDDPDYIYENQYIQSINFRFFQWMFSTFHMQNWHPLTWFSHAVDYGIWGLNPIGHHLTSIIFHVLNTFLVVILIIRLLNNRFVKLLSPLSGNQYYQTTLITAALTGILFGLHPIHVESVAWVSERKDVLCAFFLLLSVLFYLQYTSSSLQKKKPLNYALCLSFFIFALMSKPMAVTLPVVLFILDIYPLERLEVRSAFNSHRKVLIEKLPFLGLSLASSVITIVAQQREIVSFEVNLIERFLIAFQAVSFYLFKMLWPTDLSPLYPYPSKISLLSLQYIAGLILVVGITAFCIWSWKKQKVFLAVWAYYIVTLLPALGIIKVGIQAAADRYTYLPILGPMLLIGLGISWLWEKSAAKQKRLIFKRVYIITPTILLLSILSIMTIKQIEVWRDSMTLWNKELKLYSIPEAYNNRGNAYLSLGNYQQAIEDFNKAIELDPNYAKAHNNRGLAYGSLGKYDLAIENFDATINLNNRESRAYYNRGNVFKALGNYQKAIEDYNRAIELNPKKADDYNNRGNTFLKLNNYQRAIEDFSMAIEFNPKYDKAYLNRGVAYEKLGNYKQAIIDYQISARLGNKQVQDYLKSKGIVW